MFSIINWDKFRSQSQEDYYVGKKMNKCQSKESLKLFLLYTAVVIGWCYSFSNYLLFVNLVWFMLQKKIFVCLIGRLDSMVSALEDWDQHKKKNTDATAKA